MEKEKFMNLPEEVQTKCKRILKAYDEVHVVFECGEYNVGTGLMLKVEYAPDHKLVGSYSKDEVFTKEEQIVNYIEAFHDYPSEYSGRKDLNLISQLNNIGWDAKVGFNTEGNIILV